MNYINKNKYFVIRKLRIKLSTNTISKQTGDCYHVLRSLLTSQDSILLITHRQIERLRDAKKMTQYTCNILFRFKLHSN